MKRTVVFILLFSLFLTLPVYAEKPPIGEDAWIKPAHEPKVLEETGIGYSDAEINQITNVVNGEVGGIIGTVVLTYADGSQLYTDACTLHKIHACIVDNQVKSSLFPSSVYSCVNQCWSYAYTGTGYNSSAQWQHCREDVAGALQDHFRDGTKMIPSNVFAATCDPYFASCYSGWKLWARVDWNTGWFSGTFYYYCYR